MSPEAGFEVPKARAIPSLALTPFGLCAADQDKFWILATTPWLPAGSPVPAVTLADSNLLRL